LVPDESEEEEPRDDFNDGGTGGTGAQHSRPETDCGSLIDLSKFACIEERGAETAAGRRALFGDKSLRPKLFQLRTWEAEVEALMQIRTQILKRLPVEAGTPVAVPAVLEAGMSRTPEAELVRRLRLHEEALAGVPEKFVTQACRRALGSSSLDNKHDGLVERSVDLKEMKKHYAEILKNVDSLVQERISQLHTELEKLDAEVGEIEDDCYKLFCKMDEEATGSISSGQFVAFVCTQERPEVIGAGEVVVVSPEDAETLFTQMSHGQSELTFEQFKDEITGGCLEVLQANMVTRKEVQKKYRDTWF
jgi:hypothetical protein